jgi:hypothetical protein
VVIGHIALALLCVGLLHGLDDSVRRLLYAAGKEWCALLCRLMAGGCTPYDVTEAEAAWRAGSGPTRAPPLSVLPADAVVRRGPPLLPLPYAAA